MEKYLERLLASDNELLDLTGIRLMLKRVLSGKNYILYFISPKIRIKSEIFMRVINKYKEYFSDSEKNSLSLLALDFDSESILKNINFRKCDFREEVLIKIYAFYAKNRYLDEEIIESLIDYKKSVELENRIGFLINTILAEYYLSNNSVDMAEKYIKFCIQYLNYNIDADEYENMVIYLLCSKYLTRSRNIFTGGAENYYILAAELAKSMDDKISLCAIYDYLAYYYYSGEEMYNGLNYAYKAERIARRLDLPIMNFNINRNLGMIYLSIGNYEKAIFHIKIVDRISNEIENLSNLEKARLYNTLGFTYCMNGDFLESKKWHLDAFNQILKVENVADLLDEAIKTFDNLSNVLLFLGDVDKSIYFSKLATKVVIDIDSRNRTNEVNTRCKQNIDLALIYGMFKDNYIVAKEYYDMARESITKDEHYTKICSLEFLRAYFEYIDGNETLARKIYEEALATILEKGESNMYVCRNIICYRLFFTKLFSLWEEEIDSIAIFAEKNNLLPHYYVYFEYFFGKGCFEDIYFNEADYPINLILLLSAERSKMLAESNKAFYFELVKYFADTMGKINDKSRLLDEANAFFEKHFLSNGTLYFETEGEKEITSRLACNEMDLEKRNKTHTDLVKFLLDNKDLFTGKGRNYKVLDSRCGLLPQGIKSAMVFYSSDLFEGSCNLVIYNSDSCGWNFNNNDAKTCFVLIENLFLIYKNLLYTHKIRVNSLTDPLTNLYNARFFWKQINKYIGDYNDYGRTVSLVLIDLNKFKTINDTYGHSCGDAALKFFGNAMTLVIRDKKAKLIRYGGDEFIIILPDVSKEEGAKMILDLKAFCNQNRMDFCRDKILINFSFGIDTFSDKFESVDSFFSSIDKSMYKYKNKETLTTA